MNVATYSGNYTWVDDDGNPYSPPGIKVSAAYKVSSIGCVPIPDQAAAGAEFDMPFQGMSSGASLIWIRNKTGQELNMAWGGNWFPHLAVDGFLLWAAPLPPTAGGIVSLRFMLTQVQQGPGKITFALFGE